MVDVGLEKSLEKNLSVLLVCLLGEKRLRWIDGLIDRWMIDRWIDR